MGGTMALITCGECGREISDKAPACVGCGAPIEMASKAAVPTAVLVQPDSTFVGTKTLLVQLAANAILQIGWKLDSADEQAGTVTFTTGMSMGVKRLPKLTPDRRPILGLTHSR
jgi:hypothetical protein